MKKLSEFVMIGLLIFAGVIFVGSLFSLFSGRSGRTLALPALSGRIGLVEIRGVILNSEPVIRVIDGFRDDSSIRALLVRIDSPGGGVAASQEIYDALLDARESGMHVVASMSSTAASGGYYVACAADTIVANPGTATGSIGVVLSLLNYAGLADKLGIRYNVIKSGPFKDIGDASRPMRPDEERVLQAFIDDAYGQFVDVVAEARQLPRERVLELADGRVFTGKQALEAGLVDALGSFKAAISITAAMAELSEDPDIVRPRRRKTTLFDLLTQDVNELFDALHTLPVLRYQLIM